MKTCFKCGAEKPLTEYYKHKEMADGHLNKCKICTKLDAKNHRESNIDRIRGYDRKRHLNDPDRRKKSLEASKSWRKRNKKIHTQKTREWRERNPDKYKAQTAVGNAVRDGRLVKEPCQVCGDQRVHAHHEDYTKPLDVVWLCHQHHVQWHYEERNGKDTSVEDRGCAGSPH